MAEPRISVIVVSLGRPEALKRCLMGIAQLDYGPFEVVVVSDADGHTAARGLPFGSALRLIACADPNISRARNLGAAAAGGELLAFIDDDAVPEPTWLRHLAEGIDDRAAAVGYVRGRNGISFQSRADAIDRRGVTVAADTPVEAAVPICSEGFVPKLIGTNMAVRRDCLRCIGGFDESFRFYLEDGDLSLRLAEAGMPVAAVPAAEVHHSFAASSRRTGDRVPLSLGAVGRSLALFLRKHAPAGAVEATKTAARDEQRRRLLRHMVAGRLEPRDIARLLATFETGFADGGQASFGQGRDIGDPGSFMRFDDAARHKGHDLFVGGRRERRRLRALAEQTVRGGGRATVIVLSPTAVFHQLRFMPGGYWEQGGGVFGRSDRSQPLIRWISRTRRVSEELRRVAKVRGIGEIGAGEEAALKT